MIEWRLWSRDSWSVQRQGTRPMKLEGVKQRVLVPKGPDLGKWRGGAESLSSQGTRPGKVEGWSRES